MMRFVKKLFGGHKAPAARSRQRTAARLEVEGLEERSLMAAGLGLSALGAVSHPMLSHTPALVNQLAPNGPLPSSVVTNPLAYTPDTTFYYNNGSVGYWIDVPSSYDATHQTPTELFVWSHGSGGYSQYDVGTFASTAGGPTYITIGLDGCEGGSWNDDMSTFSANVMAAIADVKTHFNINPQQVVLGGYSAGGDLSYRVAFTNSTQIAGVLVENTSPFRDTGLTQGQALAAPFHFHIVHLAHLEDDTYPIDDYFDGDGNFHQGVRSETDAVKAAGAAGDGWASLLRIERHGTHWDDDHWDDNYGWMGTVYDAKTYLLPHLGDGWTSPSPIQGGVSATASFQDTQDWGTGFTGYITLTNTGNSDIKGWTLQFDFSGNITDIWDAQIVSHVGNHYVVQNASWDATIAAGQSVNFGFNADWGADFAAPTNYTLNGTPINQI